MVVIHEDHTITVTYRYYAHADVNRTGAWTKKKKGETARVSTAASLILFNQVHIHLLMHPIRCHTQTYIKPALMP